MLYWYGIKVGVFSLLRRKTSREVFKNIIVPANYWRTLEFRLTFDELQPESTDCILDIGSPKLLSLFLADVIGAEVYSTDLKDYFFKDYVGFCKLLRIPEQQFHVSIADGRHLPFVENFFSKIFSISVLEHIPDNGDSACVKEIARTLAPRGICVITVPFASSAKEEYKQARDFYWADRSRVKEQTTQVFYQRRYSEAALYDRLINPSGLKLQKLIFVGETFPLPKNTELARFLPPITGVLHPLLSFLFHTHPERDWRRIRKPLCALIVLRKG
ncbi:MAG: class I SAM-dependent methyltransferase [Bacteroidota bacterium]